MFFHLINNVDNQNAVSSLWREKLVNFAGLLKVILTHMLCKWDCLMSGEGSLSCLCPPMFYSMFLFKFFTVFLPDIRFIHGFKVCPGLFCRVSITVHMFDNKTDCLKVIAEYGQEYGKDNPIRVLYHGYGHYDALRSSSRSSLSKK